MPKNLLLSIWSSSQSYFQDFKEFADFYYSAELGSAAQLDASEYICQLHEANIALCEAIKIKMVTIAEPARPLPMTDDQLSFTLLSEMDILYRDILEKIALTCLTSQWIEINNVQMLHLR